MQVEEHEAIAKIRTAVDHAELTGVPISLDEAFRLFFRGGVAWERTKPMPAAEKIHNLAFQSGFQAGVRSVGKPTRKPRRTQPRCTKRGVHRCDHYTSPVKRRAKKRSRR